MVTGSAAAEADAGGALALAVADALGLGLAPDEQALATTAKAASNTRPRRWNMRVSFLR
jgi:hypothetical protein